MLRIAIDQDQVLADLNSKWLRVYNEEWNDNLCHHDITDWNISAFTKPQCGVKMYEIIERPGFYSDLDIIAGAGRGVRELKAMGCDITVVSASPMTAYTDKHIWLNKHFPEIDNIIFAQDKSWISADVMIDDGTHNLETFNGYKLLYDMPYNKSEHRFARMKDWEEIVEWTRAKITEKQQKSNKVSL